MFRWCWIVTFGLTLAAVMVMADSTTAPATRPDLSAVLNQLAADEPADRQTAQDQIVQIGLSAIDPLQALIASTHDVEQRTGAQAAIARIREQALTGPTMITMKLDNATPKDIVAELSKQAGVPITLRGTRSHGGMALPTKVSIDIQQQPLWEAIRQVCKATGTSLNPNARPGETLNISANGERAGGPCVVDGPFMIVVQSIVMSSNVQLNQPGNVSRNEGIQFYCFAEPKLQISQHPYSVKLTEVTDDTGKSLVLNDMDNVYESFNADSPIMWQAAAQLAVPDAAAKRITKLKGTLHLQSATKIHTIEIPDILNVKNATESAGAYSLTVKDVSAAGDEVTMNISLTVPPNNSNMGYVLAQKIRLLDAQGNALQHRDSSGGGGVTKLEYKLTYSKRTYEEGQKLTGDPVKLVLPVVLETKPIEFSFEFKDLPLP